MDHLFSFRSPVGILVIRDDGDRILSLEFDGREIIPAQTALQKETEEQLNEYFNGKRKGFELPLCLKGTDFQIQIWHALQNIPYGKTVSYQDIADVTGHGKACRAIGNAIHENPIPVIVPCHIVIRKDGSTGGYAGGSERKKILLELEKKYA